MRTVNSLTEMLLTHVAVPTENLQMVGESHLSNSPPPVPRVEFLSIFFPVPLMVYREERTAGLSTANALPAVVSENFQSNLCIALVMVLGNLLTIAGSIQPCLMACITSGTLCFARRTRLPATTLPSTIAGIVSLPTLCGAGFALPLAGARWQSRTSATQSESLSVGSPFSFVFAHRRGRAPSAVGCCVVYTGTSGEKTCKKLV